MYCISCINPLYSIIYETKNCVDRSIYPTYYLNKSNNISFLFSCYNENSNCYECSAPYENETIQNCLSCKIGYEFIENDKTCFKCNENSYKYVYNDFYNCNKNEIKNNNFLYCNKKKTICTEYTDQNFTECPDDAPILYTLNKTCMYDYCSPEEYKNGICITKNIKFKNKIPYISWLNIFDEEMYPSFYVDTSGNLLIETTKNVHHVPLNFILLNCKQKERNVYFFDKEGRGIFDSINDISNKKISYDDSYYRFISTSISVNVNNNDSDKYLLNFEYLTGNLELINLKTGKNSIKNIKNIYDDISHIDLGDSQKRYPAISLLELNEKNKYLLSYIGHYFFLNNYVSNLVILYFDFLPIKEKINIDINSIHIINYCLLKNVNKTDSQISSFQTKRGDIVITFIDENSCVNLLKFDDIENCVIDYWELFDEIEPYSLYKIIHIKDEIGIFFYFLEYSYYGVLYVFDFKNKTSIFYHNIELYYLNYDDCIFSYCSDIIKLNEKRFVLVSQQYSGRVISFYINDFVENYSNIKINIYQIYTTTINQTMWVTNRYSLLFKYKDILGFQFNNLDGKNGFILFGYFNSTDPPPIYNIKKDGLNLKLILNNYLTLQSNLFGYEIRGIKIISIPDSITTGLYFILNDTQISENNIINYNSEISLYFSYNGFLKKGRHIFKFAGILQEPSYEKNIEYADYYSLPPSLENADEISKIEYEKTRNYNIIGRTSLLEINILDDIKVFCDEKYNENDKKYCDNKIFYDVENANEITQKLIGENYYFDYNKNVYIKCHQRCKKCSKEYNLTNMQCDKCINETHFFNRNGNCLEYSNCNNNYFYDKNFDIICINKSNSCPDFKPYELTSTKECINKCDISEFSHKCNPTNNNISINDAYNQIIDNINNLNLNEKLFIKKERYFIEGNNVSFIFTTTELEKNTLYNNSQYSSILIKNCENKLKEYYSIKNDLPLPILKIETRNNYSNFMDVHYEIYNPLNLKEKLDLGICENTEIEIRLPIQLNDAYMKIINETKKLGYNIFDFNDNFYTDICSVFSYNGSDIILSDRKSLLNLSNESLCLNNCSYVNIDLKTMRSICNCSDYKIHEQNANNNFNNDVDFKSSISFSKNTNIKAIKCLKLIFNKDNLKQNYCFYLMLIINVVNILLMIFFPVTYIEKQLINFTKSILEQVKKVYENTNNAYSRNKNNELKFGNQNTYNKKDNILKINFKNSNNEISINQNKKNSSDRTLFKFDRNLNHTLQLEKNENYFSTIYKEKIKDSEYYIYKLISSIPFTQRKDYLTDSEIHDLSYKYAIEIDDRKIGTYYWSLLKVKNKVIFSFLNQEDYNVPLTKISLFILLFNLSFTVNALFFNDETIHQIYKNYGSFNLEYQISQILYSAVISTVISQFIQYFALTHNDIIKIRKKRTYNEAVKFSNVVIKKGKIKFLIFSIFGIILNLFFYYYITAFGAVYPNAQTHMISDSLLSFLLSISYSILLSILPPFLRMYSLKSKKKNRHWLYALSWIIALI